MGSVTISMPKFGHQMSLRSVSKIVLQEAQLVKENIALVIVTHDAEIGGRATRQLHMLDGRIVSDDVRRT